VPRGKGKKCERREREHSGSEQALGEEGDAGADPEQRAVAAREAANADGDAGDKGVVGDELMRVLQIAKRAGEE
jgi:hypothetical protein